MSLPYGFDLLWDVKELSQLKREYWWAKGKAVGMERMAQEHGIDLGEHPPWEYCVGCNDRVELNYAKRCETCAEAAVGKVCVICDDEAELDGNNHCCDCARNAAMLADDA